MILRRENYSEFNGVLNILKSKHISIFNRQNRRESYKERSKKKNLEIKQQESPMSTRLRKKVKFSSVNINSIADILNSEFQSDMLLKAGFLFFKISRIVVFYYIIFKKQIIKVKMHNFSFETQSSIQFWRPCKTLFAINLSQYTSFHIFVSSFMV